MQCLMEVRYVCFLEAAITTIGRMALVGEISYWSINYIEITYFCHVDKNIIKIKKRGKIGKLNT